MAVFGGMSDVYMSGLKGVAVSSGIAGSSGIFYTTDGGLEWLASNLTTAVGSGGYTPNYLAISGDNAVALCQNLSPAATVYFSTNGGQTWTASTYLGNPLSITGDSAIAITGSNAIVSTGTNLYYSSDGGATWALSTVTGKTFYSIQISSSLNAIGSTDGGIYFSTNAGATWTISVGSPVTYCLAVSMSNSGKAIIATNSGLYYSTNYGASVTLSVSIPAMTWRNSVSIMPSADKCIAVSSTGTLWYSVNAGQTWTATTVTGLAESNCAIMISDDETAVAGNSGTSRYSTDAGQNWTTSSTPISNSNLGAVYLSGLTGIMSDNTALYYTDDGGDNWILAQQIFPPPPPVICFKEGSKILTDKGYIAVQDLRNGDLVKTVSSGFKKIEHIGFSKMYNNANDTRSKDKLYRCSTSEYPELTEDLIVTGCHSILVKNFKDYEQVNKTQEVLGKIYITDTYYRLPACVDERTKIFEEEGVHTIWHFSLEHSDYYMNYGVYANGLLVETTSNRMMVELSGMTLV